MDPSVDPGPLLTDAAELQEFSASADGGGVGSVAATLTATRPAGWDIRAWASFVTSEFQGRPWSAAWAGPAGYQRLQDVGYTFGKGSQSASSESITGTMAAPPVSRALGAAGMVDTEVEAVRGPAAPAPIDAAEYHPTPGGNE